jgi:hypothetical protein
VSAVCFLSQLYSSIDLRLRVNDTHQAHITLPRGHANIKAIYCNITIERYLDIFRHVAIRYVDGIRDIPLYTFEISGGLIASRQQ